jgi:hypothetical protein
MYIMRLKPVDFYRKLSDTIDMEKMFTNQEIRVRLFWLWLACVGVSLVGCYLKWSEIPLFPYALGISHLTAFMAFPKSLTDLIMLTQFGDQQNTLPVILVFWPVFLALIILLFKLKYKILFMIVSIISLLASFNWLANAWLMIQR